MRRLLLTAALAFVPALMFAGSQPPDSAAVRGDDDARLTFTWGAEAGSSIDLSANDMSSIDINASFGIRQGIFTFAGIGAGANIMISNSCRTYPIFAILRTDFSRRVKLLFLDVRGGMALNYLPDNATGTGAYASVGVGINLARSRKFRSYILAGYTYVGRGDVTSGEAVTHYPALNVAMVRLGISF